MKERLLDNQHLLRSISALLLFGALSLLPASQAQPPACQPDYLTPNSALTETDPATDWANNHLQDPYTMILCKLSQDAQVVALGEIHREELMEQFAAQLVQQAARKDLIQFVALEIEYNRQSDVDYFLETGIVNKRLQTVLDLHGSYYFQLLKHARAYKLKVVCADTKSAPSRDTFMNEMILSYLNAFPNEHGIFYVGNGHVVKYQDKLAQELQDKYFAVVQLNYRDANNDPIFQTIQKLKVPHSVGIDQIDASPFAQAMYPSFLSPYPYGDVADGAVIHPSYE